MKKILFITIALLIPLAFFGQTAEDNYEKGRKFFVQNDFANALIWFEKAANQGHTEAMVHVGLIYCFNKGVPQDFSKAKEWYLKASDLGNSNAMCFVGLLYMRGEGVTQDYQTAREWFQKALKTNPNNASAKEYLAELDGKNVKQSSSSNNLAQNTTTTTTQPKLKEQLKRQPIIQSRPNAGIDLVDTGIPVISRVNKNAFAIIIANEDYQSEANVDFARNDGEVFKNYCHMTLGLPEKNIHFVANATLNNLIGELDWLQQVCEAYGGDASVIFYYAGHGIPDEASGSAYLLPTDGNSRLLRTCFSVNELYEILGKLPAKKVTVLMDACFSGAKRNGDMLAAARGVAIKAKSSAPKGSMIVLSAAQGSETAYKYDDAKHGLFTYFLLKKLKDSNGNVTMGELSSYITEQVKRYSIVENGKSQTPTIQTSDNLRGTWESLKLD